ncbi:MAG: hypothetical protein AAGA47_02815 [Pseudomonadota bacterium]
MRPLLIAASLIALPGLALGQATELSFGIYTTARDKSESADEADDFSVATVGLRYGTSFASGVEVIGGATYQYRFDPEEVSGNRTDDTLASAFQLDLQLGTTRPNGVYAGGLLSVGALDASTDTAEEAEIYVLGGEASSDAGAWTLGGQLGYLVSEADDNEGLDNASFGVVYAERPFGGPLPGIFDVAFTYALGEQDSDSGGDDLDYLALSVGARFDIPPIGLATGSSVDIALGYTSITEDSGGSTEIEDTTIAATYTLRFGNDGRLRRGLPSFTAWSGAVHAVD